MDILISYTCIYIGTYSTINYVFITGVPRMVPNVTVDNSTNGNIITFTLNWGEPFNNYNPIVNYTVSCSGDVTCPPNFTTTARSYTITNLTPMTNYTFSVVATNSIGRGEVIMVMITTPPATTVTTAATTITSIESMTVSMPSQSIIATTSSSIESSSTATIYSTSMITITISSKNICMYYNSKFHCS